ncbi:hypothetical protein SLE2022_155690 [Rubroshorea leprosula]
MTIVLHRLLLFNCFNGDRCALFIYFGFCYAENFSFILSGEELISMAEFWYQVDGFSFSGIFRSLRWGRVEKFRMTEFWYQVE